MMQANAKIANNTIQNDMRMQRRSSFHHGSSKYEHSSSSVRTLKLYDRKAKRNTKKERISIYLKKIGCICFAKCCDTMRKHSVIVFIVFDIVLSTVVMI